ncbi:MAG TPA: valine--tRNA ligase [Saprospiraceae bacterium]|nr:valine--tRNA ligase [Saprospiraceae bacterium]
MALSTRYNPKETETKWYDHWIEQNYFHSEPDDREPFTIVIPPPNVTGVLHMGHMLNNTIQDILIRRARLQGYNACWVPGTDHASIATEAKVVKRLREKGVKKGDLSREEFLNHAFQWKDEYGGKILDQLKKLGASCDWERTRFTMEDNMSSAVIRVFVDLYRKGKLYRKLRMTNWDPVAQTVLSNEEVIYKDENSRLFFVRYAIEGSEDEYITIATVRPETILGDTAIAVHPDDERFQHLHGKKAIVPIVNRPVPVIADPYVDMEFGTGALKITPAHDMNDYEIGQKHDLETIDVLNADASMSDAAGPDYAGLTAKEARKKIVIDLEEAEHLIKVEDYRNKVGRSERTDAVVEPRLTEQWFLSMEEFAQTALKAVESGEVTFYPEHFWNMFNSWLREENVRDWCISRQLWWGQQIPAWYYQDQVFVAQTEEEALAQAQEALNNPNLTVADLKRDEDVVDTWFSSWLWPMTVFDGFESPEELSYYYPTNVLVTGWDIMFFWVARMIMSGYEWSEELLGKELVAEKGRQPFYDVYFTGMVRDNKRRKMSKSLGNSPEALKLIEEYGADGVRFGMLSSAAAGNDIIFDAPFDPETQTVLNESKLCEQGRNFCNKMWNALRLLKNLELTNEAPSTEKAAINELAYQWLAHKLHQVVEQVEKHFEAYRLSDALMTLYKFIKDDFCSWYLEMIKPEYGQPIEKKTLEKSFVLFEQMMTLLHPFMPFVTEEIWHRLRDRLEGEDCVVSEYPVAEDYNEDLIQKVEQAKTVVSSVREVRSSKGIKMKDPLKLFAQDTKGAQALLATAGLKDMIVKMANLESLEFTSQEVPNTISFLAGTEQFFLELNQEVDTEAECQKLKEDLEYQEGFLQKVNKKLGNERFVTNAPEKVVAMERKKQADATAKIQSIKEAMEQLGCG